jgi:hypothetical protein
MRGSRPEFRLVLRDPVGFGLFLEEAHRVAHADGRAVPLSHHQRRRRIAVGGASLVEPDHEGRKGCSRRHPVRRHVPRWVVMHHAGGRASFGMSVLAHSSRQASHRLLPEGLGVVFQPARLAASW